MTTNYLTPIERNQIVHFAEAAQSTELFGLLAILDAQSDALEADDLSDDYIAFVNNQFKCTLDRIRQMVMSK